MARLRGSVFWTTQPGLGPGPSVERSVCQKPVGRKLKAVLDTSVLISTDVPELEGELAISSASLTELYFGVLVTVDAGIRAERLRRLSELQRKFDALPIDDAVAVSYGK